jgi:hypothetical protein
MEAMLSLIHVPPGFDGHNIQDCTIHTSITEGIQKEIKCLHSSGLMNTPNRSRDESQYRYILNIFDIIDN